MSGGSVWRNAIPFRFERFDRLRFAGREYVYLRDTDEGHLLRNVLCDLEEAFTHPQLAEKLSRRDFRHDRRFFAEGNVNARAASGVASLAEIPIDELPKMLFKHEFCCRFLKMEAAGEASRSDASMDGERDECNSIVIPGVIAGIAASLALAAAQNARIAGQTITTFKPPCAKTLRRWLTAFESGGLQAYALRGRDRHKGNRKPRLPSETYALIEKHSLRYMSEKRPRIETLYEDLNVDLAKINAERAADGMPAIAKPSIQTFSVRVHALPAFNVDASRNGLDYAKRRFNLVAGKPEVVRPGERVEIDEWSINLQKILIEVGLWTKLSKAEQKAFTGRRVACVAIDVATRCILGLRIAPTANADLARETLRMVVSNKGRIAAAAGAKTPWDMRTTPDLLVSDGGSAFISDLWASAVGDIQSERDVAKCKMPHLRGTIERAFRTCDINLLPRFTGRSFANIDEKGDYDSEARASLSEEDLAWSLVRWVVDIYHNKEHGGLGHETPRNAWLRLSRTFGVRPPPDIDRTLAALGVRLTRQLGQRGVRFLGNHYRCEAMARAFMTRHVHEVAIRVDEGDLGRISVEIDDAWHIADCVGRGFDDVSMETWLAALQDLRRRFAVEAEITRPIVLEAIAAINARAALAEQRVGIVSFAPAPERIAKAEEELMVGFYVPAEIAGEGSAGKDNVGAPGDLFDMRFDTGGDRSWSGSASEAPPPAEVEPWFSIEDD